MKSSSLQTDHQCRRHDYLVARRSRAAASCRRPRGCRQNVQNALAKRPHPIEPKSCSYSSTVRAPCKRDSLMHRPTGLYRLHRHKKSLTSLQFDVVCCTLIYGCERRSFCAKTAINYNLGLRILARKLLSVSVSWNASYSVYSLGNILCQKSPKPVDAS